MNEPLTLLAALILGTLGVARVTRLVTADAYPPMSWLRLRWSTWTAQTERREGWEPLLTCPFCFAPYAAAVSLYWFYWSAAWTGFGGIDTARGWWWALSIWAAGSYLSAMIVVRDEPPEED